ncbi:MAG: alpha/beta hydrolase [Candidatus ainarchaeum sp.]|nr:alpha/beta hydrolase [Candidatus ainarchaeum sp.]
MKNSASRLHWFPWLKEKLEELGCRVFVPAFPTPENQSLQNWLAVFQEYQENLDNDSIVVGHSLGPAFLLSILEKAKKPIKAAFFIAGFTGSLGNHSFDEVNRTFVEKNFDWKKIRKNCKSFFVFNSDNDPYVPIEKGKELAEKLGTKLIIVKGAGHFNKAAGYTKFELLLEKIKKEL